MPAPAPSAASEPSLALMLMARRRGREGLWPRRSRRSTHRRTFVCELLTPATATGDGDGGNTYEKHALSLVAIASPSAYYDRHALVLDFCSGAVSYRVRDARSRDLILGAEDSPRSMSIDEPLGGEEDDGGDRDGRRSVFGCASALREFGVHVVPALTHLTRRHDDRESITEIHQYLTRDRPPTRLRRVPASIALTSVHAYFLLYRPPSSRSQLQSYSCLRSRSSSRSPLHPHLLTVLHVYAYTPSSAGTGASAHHGQPLR